MAIDVSKGIPTIKQDATFTIGTAFVQQLQVILMYLCESLDPAEVERKVTAKEQLSAQEQHIVNLTSLLRAIYTEADNKGDIYYQDIPKESTSI